MLDQALLFVKDALNRYLRAQWAENDARQGPVVFLSGDQMEPITFPLGQVTLLLINIEAEPTARNADPYRRTREVDGQPSPQTVHPSLALNLYLLFVARYPAYDESLRALSQIVRYFQRHRFFSSDEVADSPFEKLTMELITLPFAQQNEIWNALRVTYHPSLLYKLRMVVIEDDDPQPAVRVERVMPPIVRRINP
ncbi:MAG: DUF4255 domain-containing protein [Anaerolineales bacterium]|nr:DUF4255 domain-containing protein [Anaerolineales bacterium]MCB0011348.1 DUF4255 domain-containing protein [Anaerolineales bacterium]MCB0017658.1 DUF4255 domain-containing protein [Anaerolineales bacterium]MCB0031541.1 DUF4255 domain-containing protein [Anaerolineales bacterium]MCB8962999.1 DUF4255 domain-containing protein [Ardenticatenales bacterium]